MLRTLKVKDFALIDHAELEFAEGLNVLTGETGAGKSLVIDCLAMVSGSRADAQYVKKGREAAVIEAAFDITDNAPARDFLNELGIEPSGDGSVVLSREIQRSGKSRARLEGRLVTAAEQKAAAGFLLDIFGQNDGELLLKPSAQLASVDLYLDAKGRELLEEVSRAFALWRQATEELDLLIVKASDRQQRLDYLIYQVEELEVSAVAKGEEARLLAEAKVLANAGKILSHLERAYAILYDTSTDEKSAVDLARMAELELDSAVKSGSQGLDVTMVSEAAELLKAAAEAARRAADAVVADPERASEVEARLAEIGRVKRKFRIEADELEAHLASLKDEAVVLRELEIRTEGARQKVQAARESMMKAMEELSALRRKAATALEDAVAAELRDLMMPSARFSAGLRPRGSQNGIDSGEGIFSHQSGLEAAEFYFSANLGEDPMPLAKVASGGELSRFMLALKVAGQKRGDDRAVMVFDEVDQGVGGVAANHVAAKLKQAASRGQAIAVTHLAQIAAAASRHIRIVKSEADASTIITVEQLDENGRAAELARMLSGSADGEALAHARTMLKAHAGGKEKDSSQDAATKGTSEALSLFK